MLNMLGMMLAFGLVAVMVAVMQMGQRGFQ
jgi:hypothetical protein